MKVIRNDPKVFFYDLNPGDVFRLFDDPTDDVLMVMEWNDADRDCNCVCLQTGETYRLIASNEVIKLDAVLTINT